MEIIQGVLATVSFAIVVAILTSMRASNRDKINRESEIRELTKQNKEKLDEIIPCLSCGCLINKSNSYIVEVYTRGRVRVDVYCYPCKPNYTRSSFDDYISKYRNFKEIEVDINGEPIGYKKK